MMQFYNILKRIENRPAMWTGEHTLKSIRIFLNGYSVALEDYQIETKSWPSFHDWVANKLGFKESTAGWQNMILASVSSAQSNSIDWLNFDKDVTIEQHDLSIKMFYELLDEFAKENTAHNTK